MIIFPRVGHLLEPVHVLEVEGRVEEGQEGVDELELGEGKKFNFCIPNFYKQSRKKGSTLYF